MHARCPCFCPAGVQTARGHFDVVPAEGHKLARSQAMPVGNEDGRGVPVAPAVLSSRIHELLDLPLGQILARSTLTSWHCYIYCCWSLLERVRNFHGFAPLLNTNCYSSMQKHNS